MIWPRSAYEATINILVGAYIGIRELPGPLRDPNIGAPDDRIHKAPPGPERANFRSATPMGFALAVFDVNARTTEAVA